MKQTHKVWLAYLTGILVILVTVRLGVWQWQRAHEKSEKMQLWTQAMQCPPQPWQGNNVPQNYQRLVLSGQWLLSQQILIDNRLDNGQAGFHVITPLLLPPSHNGVRRIVPINRGWVAKPARGLPVVASPAIQTIIVRHEPLPKFFVLQQDEVTHPIWQNLDWPLYQKKIGPGLQPMYSVALSDLGDGLKRDWPLPDLGQSRHQAYAAQWFGLALLTLGLMAYFTVKHYCHRRQKAFHVE
jgi:surfeit locus 1 family protein